MINEKRFYVVVKTNSGKNDFKGYDKNKGAYKVNVKTLPTGGKANLEVVKFLSKFLGKKVKIVSGFRNKLKLVEAVD